MTLKIKLNFKRKSHKKLTAHGIIPKAVAQHCLYKIKYGDFHV